MAEYWTGAHTRHRLQVHLVWIPKYRRRVIRGKIAIRLRQLLREASTMNRWQIREMSLEHDHIHLIMQIKPSDSISGVVQILKGGTSRALRKEYPELEEFLWGDSYWGWLFCRERRSRGRRYCEEVYQGTAGKVMSRIMPEVRNSGL